MSLQLPEAYKQYIKNKNSNVEIEFNNQEFWLKSIDSLEEAVRINKNTTEYWRQMESFVLMYRVLSGEPNGVLLTDSSDEIHFDHLLKCIVIGEDSNGDIIYIDPLNNFSIWRHFHDGADLEVLSPNIESFLSNMKELLNEE